MSDARDQWSQAAVDAAQRVLVKDLARMSRGQGPQCLEHVESYNATVLTFERYRRVDFAPKKSCFDGFGGGWAYVVLEPENRVVEAAVIE
jgi:hypothetical protein